MDQDNIQNKIVENDKGPDLHIGDFSGPLDLLLYLIDKNEIDIFDIPIASLTNQYLEYLQDIEIIDMDNVSNFIIVGADLVRLKSKMILPDYSSGKSDEDPRNELVWRLLLYRRAKYIASELKEREELYAGVIFRNKLSNSELGIENYNKEDLYADASEFSGSKFQQAMEGLAARNAARFQDLSEKIEYIVKRKHLSVLDQITRLNEELEKHDQVNFNKIYAKAESKAELLTGFLAILEMLKENNLDVYQRDNFSDIILTKQSKDKKKEVNNLEDASEKL